MRLPPLAANLAAAFTYFFLSLYTLSESSMASTPRRTRPPLAQSFLRSTETWGSTPMLSLRSSARVARTLRSSSMPHFRYRAFLLGRLVASSSPPPLEGRAGAGDGATPPGARTDKTERGDEHCCRAAAVGLRRLVASALLPSANEAAVTTVDERTGTTDGAVECGRRFRGASLAWSPPPRLAHGSGRMATEREEKVAEDRSTRVLLTG
uniref:Uncharacterized protein n=1 Tax=Zea mays TaxID=4577 RepID=C0PC86_MAIZE|nr:unknown [Zea mays]